MIPHSYENSRLSLREPEQPAPERVAFKNRSACPSLRPPPTPFTCCLASLAGTALAGVRSTHPQRFRQPARRAACGIPLVTPVPPIWVCRAARWGLARYSRDRHIMPALSLGRVLRKTAKLGQPGASACRRRISAAWCLLSVGLYQSVCFKPRQSQSGQQGQFSG